MKYKNYVITENSNTLIFVNVDTNKMTSVRVIPNNTFVIKVNKNSVSAINGSNGLYKAMQSWIHENILTTWIDIVIEKFCA